MSFDPMDLTVREATARLPGLSDEELSAVYDAELEGKGRKTLLDEVTAARDSMREDEVEITGNVQEPAPAPVAAPEREIIYRPARPGSAAAAYVKLKKG